MWSGYGLIAESFQGDSALFLRSVSTLPTTLLLTRYFRMMSPAMYRILTPGLLVAVCAVACVGLQAAADGAVVTEKSMGFNS